MFVVHAPAGADVPVCRPAAEFARTLDDRRPPRRGTRRTLTVVVRPERPGVHTRPRKITRRRVPPIPTRFRATTTLGKTTRRASPSPSGGGRATGRRRASRRVGDGGIDVDATAPSTSRSTSRRSTRARTTRTCSSSGLDGGSPPDAAALADVVAAFAAAPVANPDAVGGITLHLLTDEAVPGHAGSGFRRGARRDFDDRKARRTRRALRRRVRHGGGAPRRQLRKRACRPASRVPIRIYGQVCRVPTASGIAERPGNDFLITLAGWTPEAIAKAGGRRAVEAAVLMHELGHNLGLRHGGDTDVNCKPNYLSAMNYALTFPSSTPRGRSTLPRRAPHAR